MTDGTFRIKNLSIALEAVSRINGCRSEYDRIRDLLSQALDEEKENLRKTQEAKDYSTTLPILDCQHPSR